MSEVREAFRYRVSIDADSLEDLEAALEQLRVNIDGEVSTAHDNRIAGKSRHGYDMDYRRMRP